jgi:hypothetical protein
MIGTLRIRRITVLTHKLKPEQTEEDRFNHPWLSGFRQGFLAEPKLCDNSGGEALTLQKNALGFEAVRHFALWAEPRARQITRSAIGSGD